MNGMPFVKVEATANDFPLVEADALPLAPFAPGWSEFVGRLCDRHYGIGGDGLLVVRPGEKRVELRMFNSDGTEDFCGNGLGCAALYARSRGWLGDAGVLEHFGREVPVQALDDGRFSATFEAARFDPAAVPLAPGREEVFLEPVEIASREYVVSAVNAGSTHTVIFVPELPSSRDMRVVGPLLEHHPWFPERTSVIWALVEGDDRLRIAIWERGVGETLGCGTGSAAAAVCLARRSFRTGRFAVENPGGLVEVEISSLDEPLTLITSPHEVYRGTLDPSLWKPWLAS